MRIQVLPLPLETSGEVTSEPFALIVDQVEIERAEALGYAAPVRAEVVTSLKGLESFADAIGARGLLVTDETVEVA